MTITKTPADGYRTFLATAIRHPSLVGGIAPTALGMSRTLATVVPSTHPVTVVELGAGTGSVSSVIRARLAPGSRHLAVEVNPAMIDHLRRAHPWLEVIHGDATDLGDLLTAAGAGQADAVVSTLPWSLFPGEQQNRVLSEIGRTLAPGGAFSTVVGLPALSLSMNARRFRHKLTGMFDEVFTTRTVWWNLPPSCGYVCRRPRI
jgi:phosphatidylethanolamine/phosphatidyl-N-methylethanolamine N-methyltransferase